MTSMELFRSTVDRTKWVKIIASVLKKDKALQENELSISLERIEI